MFETTSENTALPAQDKISRPQHTQITLQVNGETHYSTSPINLPELLTSLGLNPRLVAVEYNGEILHRQYWADTQLENGDRLEIVTIVGGG
ncbi:thiamine biosynthesis protein ThiS [Pleurocapsales cyanobacterium LEGE 06147]|nr:thiamine biosynthesis protein ThiS [Pleurocapsales cyanobacterium LEGE 06147]